MKNVLLIFSMLMVLMTYAQEKTESPYLKVLTPDGVIPLQKTAVDANIAGTIAHVHIQQVYHNTGSETIEAQYVFPLSTQAAVHKMTMTVGGRKTHAKIYEKQEAKKVYNDAIKEGKRASKLEQSRPNVFTMNVGNILSGDEIVIDIYYTEMLVPLDGEYSFVFPGVVGPRYTGENTSGETTFNQPYTAKGIGDTFEYNIEVSLNAGMTIQQLTSPSHQINATYSDVCSAKIFLSKNNQNPSNRDYILNYKLRGEEINTGLLLYEHDDEKFFTYTMMPPKQVKEKDIPTREYLFVVDVSGSMMGYPIEVSKKLMRNLLGNLKETDRFNVLLFASNSDVFRSESVLATEANINKAFKFLHTDGDAGGGTELINALERAYSLPRYDQDNARSMVIITDGYVSVEKEAFDLIEKNLDQANVFTFGIGSSVNRYLLEGMAKVSHAESYIATSEEEAYKMSDKFKKYIDSPVLTQIKLKTKGFEIYDVEPKAIPDVFASRPIIVHGKWKGEPKGEIIIQGKQGSKKFKETIEVSKEFLSPDNVALRYLWARKRIERLDDYHKSFGEAVKEEVTALGIQYNLLTQYTSFVAVDDEIVNKNGALKKVNQVLPMPQHVENTAIGAEVSVKSSSVFKATYTFDFTNNADLTKTEQRALKVWLRATYSKQINSYLQTYTSLIFKFNKEGKLIEIKGLKNNMWEAVKITDALALDKKILSAAPLELKINK